MEFTDHRAIYLQVGDYICERILQNEWTDNTKIPSIREIAITLEVNPNTVVKAYNDLEGNHIIHKERGIGYFVTSGARETIKQLKRKVFLERDLPNIFKTLKLLQIDIKDLEKFYQEEHHENE
jgi:DNA-binding transcriptional regulator YhcF (GntR family)